MKLWTYDSVIVGRRLAGIVVVAAVGYLAQVALASGFAAVPSYEVKLFDEYNSNSGPHYLSDRTTGMPNTELSIVGTALNGTDPDSGVSLKFTCSDSSKLQIVGGSFPTTITTNSQGQSGIVVAGTGSSGNVNITVTCAWLDANQNVRASASVIVHVYNSSATTSNSPNWISALSTPCSIKYSDTTTWMSGHTANARSSWALTGKVGFQSDSSAQITFTEVLDSMNPDGAWCESDTPRKIKFNKWHYNGDTWEILDSPSYYPPASWRHHLTSTANHELGHALGLDDNTGTLRAVMQISIARYFVWGISTWQSGELNTFDNMYPSSCQ